MNEDGSLTCSTENEHIHKYTKEEQHIKQDEQLEDQKLSDKKDFTEGLARRNGVEV